jgi:hypothetical protein
MQDMEVRHARNENPVGPRGKIALGPRQGLVESGIPELPGKVRVRPRIDEEVDAGLRRVAADQTDPARLLTDGREGR